MRDRQKRLRRLAMTDQLTGLLNRHGLESVIQERLNQDKMDQAIFVQLDIDDFKLINDIFGHRIGDEALRHLAVIMRVFFPREAVLARNGGDEFIIIMKDVTPGDVDAFLEKLARMAADYNCSGTQFMPVIPLSYAVGYAHSAQVPNSTMPMLLKVADSNMYANKAKVKAAMKDQRYAEVR